MYYYSEILESDIDIRSIKTEKVTKKNKTYYAKEDIGTIIDSATNERDRMLMRILYSSAMRRDELRKLRIEDIDFGTSDDFTHKIRCGKGGKPRSFYLDKEVLLELKAFIGDRKTGYIFQSRESKNSNKPISHNSVYYVVVKAAEGSGFRMFGPHDFRRSKATHLYEDNHVIEYIGVRLGHTKLGNTWKYIHPSVIKKETTNLKKRKRNFDIEEVLVDIKEELSEIKDEI